MRSGNGYQMIDFQQHCVIAMMRSCGGSSANGGVAYASAYYDASNSHAFVGSRLAFRGTISEVSPEQFKKLPAL